MNKRAFGNIGEELACKYLEKIGYIIIDRNFICRQGEIDIIAKDGKEFVFVEVKTRSNEHFGNPRDAVDEYKQKHIEKCTKYYLHLNGLDDEFVRFDVIEVYFLNGIYRIVHLKQVEFK